MAPTNSKLVNDTNKNLNKALLEVKNSAEFWNAGINFIITGLYADLEFAPKKYYSLVSANLESPVSLSRSD